MNPAEVILQPPQSQAPLDVADINALSSLTEFYQSDQDLDGEESEVDLMIQLSGMVYNDTESAE